MPRRATMLLLLALAAGIGYGRFSVPLLLPLVSDDVVVEEPEEKVVPTELPPSWSLEDIAKESPPYGTNDPVHVLAWKIVEDERPLRVESCLVLKVLGRNNGYTLSHLFRHPAGKKPEWQLSVAHVSGKEGTKYFPGL